MSISELRGRRYLRSRKLPDQRATDLLKKLGANQTTFVVIDEVETDNWGVGGEQVTAIRKRQR
jgi:4-oxalocrotonate tautomerase family enzyme